MQIRFLIASAGLILSMPMPAMATDSPPAVVAPAAPPAGALPSAAAEKGAGEGRSDSSRDVGASDEVVCEYVRPTGSRIREKQCRTQSQILQEKLAAEREFRNLRTNPGSAIR